MKTSSRFRVFRSFFPRIRAGAVTAAIVAISLLVLSCNRSAPPQGSATAEKGATIQVDQGSGWLSRGQQIQIAEWYSGSKGDGDYFANFRGTEGGSTVDLRFSGPARAGSFRCSDPSAPVSMEISVDVKNAYRSSAADSRCEVTVTRMNGEVVEGRYTARLFNPRKPGDGVTISGSFRASRPAQIAVASAGLPGFH